jgi:cytochrome c2
MTTAEKAKAALTKTNNSNGNGSAKEVLLKAKRPGTMLGLKAGDVKSVIEAYKPCSSCHNINKQNSRISGMFS